jgi:putative flippase GtrA
LKEAHLRIGMSTKSGPPLTVALFLRHQLGGAIASVFDFGLMSAGVELLGLRPSIATALGAWAGAIVNFVFARHVVFRAQAGIAWHQALRYGVVAIASLVFNAALEWLLAEHFHVQYFVARLVVSGVVSIVWNFPMQRYFVFAHSPHRSS